MRLATRRDGTRDGCLLVVADGPDGAVCATAPVGTLQAALDDWAVSEVLLREAHRTLAGDPASGSVVDATALAAPLPRAFQWAEGSTYLVHMERLRAARGKPLPPGHGEHPAVYQSGADAFLGPCDAVPLRDEAWGLDVEATIAVVVDDVAQETAAEEACAHIKLVLLANDLTFRNLLTQEYAVGVGFYQAKPLRPLAPYAVTPDALGDAWDGGRLSATVRTSINDEVLGTLDSGVDSAFTFPQLIAHMARTRPLAAGTVVGSGTVANRDPANGHGCLAERRAAELLADGVAATPLLRVGDHIRMEALDACGSSVFGAIDQLVATPERNLT